MGVTMIVEVKAKYTVQKEAKVGVIHTCDMCGKVLLDTTKIPGKLINDNPDICCYAVRTHKGTSAPAELCSIECIDKAYADWSSKVHEDETPGDLYFEVRCKCLQTNSILRDYEANRDLDLDLDDWNRIKHDAGNERLL